MLMGASMALLVTEKLEALNASSQSVNSTVSGIKNATEIVIKDLQQLRSQSSYQQLFASVQNQLRSSTIYLKLPRQHRTPKRLTGSEPEHHAETTDEFYRKIYYEILDTTIIQLQERVSTKSCGNILALEETLLTGEVSAICSNYPELPCNDLRNELAMFRRNYSPISCLSDAVNALKGMYPETRHLFQTVENLVRLLLVVPASSASAERSFSGLRRLKTWLRSTMSQKRLNHLAVLNAHTDLVDSIDMKELSTKFISVSDIRKNLFGHFK
jgi:hypothetical protein